MKDRDSLASALKNIVLETKKNIDGWAFLTSVGQKLKVQGIDYTAY